MVHDLFVSHSSEDSALAKQIVAALEANGVSCWVAPRDVRTGEEYQNEILRGLRESNGVLFLYSRHASKSRHVSREINIADESGKPIYPVKLTADAISGPLEYTLASRQWIDFSADPDAAVARILADLPERRQTHVRQWNWDIPEDQKRSIGRRALLGAGALVLAGVVGFFGFGFYRAHASLQQCDRLAASELELEPHAGDGVVDGMIDVAAAIPACREAASRNTNSARAAFQLMRALAANGYNTRAAEFKARAVELGHPEAVLLDVFEPGSERSDEGGVVRPAAIQVIQSLIPRAQAGDPRAMTLLASTVYSIGLSASTESAQTLLGALAPLDPDAALRRCQAGDFGAAADCASDPGGEARLEIVYRLYAVRLAQLDGAAQQQFMPALIVVDRARAEEAGYPPAVLQTALSGCDANDEGSQCLQRIRALADSHYVPAMLALANIYLSGGGELNLNVDYSEAQRLLDEAAPIVPGEEQ